MSHWILATDNASVLSVITFSNLKTIAFCYYQIIAVIHLESWLIFVQNVLIATYNIWLSEEIIIMIEIVYNRDLLFIESQ